MIQLCSLVLGILALSVVGCGPPEPTCSECLAQQEQNLPAEDGCWPYCEPTDQDGDGIADGADACPAEPETLNGYQDGDGCPDAPPLEVLTQIRSTPPAFNGGFDARDMPPCQTRTDGTIECGWPVGPAYGWTVTPSELYLSPRGNGGVFFQYGAGREQRPSLPGYPGVSDNTSLYLQLCYTTSNPGWCDGTMAVSSPKFQVAAGMAYRLGMWLRSSTFMATGQPQENRTMLSVRYYDSAGVELGTDGFVFEPNTAPTPWTEGHMDVVVPAGAAEAAIVVSADRYRQSNVYIDDVVFTPI